MKLEEGMYVRTKIGVAKIIDFEERTDRDNCYYLDKNIVEEDDYTSCCIYDYKFYLEQVKKASYNIIDLLEIGDIITFKNDDDVYKIIGVPNKKYACKFFYLAKEFDGATEDIIVGYDYMKESINSIVTKEQFESMQYKVGE